MNTILVLAGTTFYEEVSINPYKVLTQDNVYHLKGQNPKQGLTLWAKSNC